jgi:thioredoxin reductase
LRRQTAIVAALEPALDEMGYVRADEMRRTSVAGVSAAGDLTTVRQGAVIAAADGAVAGACSSTT